VVNIWEHLGAKEPNSPVVVGGVLNQINKQSEYWTQTPKKTFYLNEGSCCSESVDVEIGMLTSVSTYIVDNV